MLKHTSLRLSSRISRNSLDSLLEQLFATTISLRISFCVQAKNSLFELIRCCKHVDNGLKNMRGFGFRNSDFRNAVKLVLFNSVGTNTSRQRKQKNATTDLLVFCSVGCCSQASRTKVQKHIFQFNPRTRDCRISISSPVKAARIFTYSAIFVF